MEHGFADDFDGGEALAHEVVVEVFEVEGGALFFHHVGAELHDFEFAEGVVEVGGVGGAAFGFDEGDGVGLIALCDEEVDGLIEGELAGVELDGVDEAGVAEERVLELAEADEFGFAALFSEPGLRCRAGRSPGRASSARCSGPSLRCWCWRRELCGWWRGTAASRGTGRSGRGRPRGRWWR